MPNDELLTRIEALVPDHSSLEHWVETGVGEPTKEFEGEFCNPSQIADLQALVAELRASRELLAAATRIDLGPDTHFERCVGKWSLIQFVESSFDPNVTGPFDNILDAFAALEGS